MYTVPYSCYSVNPRMRHRPVRRHRTGAVETRPAQSKPSGQIESRPTEKKTQEAPAAPHFPVCDFKCGAAWGIGASPSHLHMFVSVINECYVSACTVMRDWS